PDGTEGDARALDRVFAGLGVAGYLLLSFAQALFHFTSGEPGPALRALAPLVDRADTFRVVNTYHLFASITRERIEPEFQTLAADPARSEDDEDAWTAHDLVHKA